MFSCGYATKTISDIVEEVIRSHRLLQGTRILNEKNTNRKEGAITAATDWNNEMRQAMTIRKEEEGWKAEIACQSLYILSRQRLQQKCCIWTMEHYCVGREWAYTAAAVVCRSTWRRHILIIGSRWCVWKSTTLISWYRQSFCTSGVKTCFPFQSHNYFSCLRLLYICR